MSEIKKNITTVALVLVAVSVLILGSLSMAYYAGYNSVDCEKKCAGVSVSK